MAGQKLAASGQGGDAGLDYGVAASGRNFGFDKNERGLFPPMDGHVGV